MSFGQVVRQRRRALGLSQKDVAARAGVSPRTLRGIELGRVAHPRHETVTRIAAVLGLGDQAIHAGLSIAVLGPLEVSNGGETVNVTSMKQRLLLGLLAIHPNQAVGLSRIAASLWEDGAPAKWRGLVHNYVARVRSVVEPDALLTHTHHGYALRIGAAALDSLRFDELTERALACDDPDETVTLLTEALSLWRGPVLADLPSALSEDPATVRMSDRRAAAALRLADVSLERGEFEAAVSALQPVAAAVPLHEGVHARLMLAMAGQGRQADALALFTRIRDRLSADLGVDPGPELTKAHLRVLRQEIPASRPELASTSPRLTPAELPADVVGFVGRADESARLRDRLLSGSGSVSAISGGGGVGKSALAVHVAWRLAGHFPDGQLYVDLRGTTPDVRPVDPHDALSYFLRSLGVKNIPRVTEEAAARFRSLAAERRLLILLDNASDAEQVRHLLPGAPSCGVLITSRRILPGLGAVQEHLDVLAEAQSIDLLRNLLGEGRMGAEPDAARELVRLCGGLPLALRIVAARLAARPAWTLSSIVERLHQRRLDQLHAGDLDMDVTFRISYSELDATHARAFRLCALPDAPDIDGAAAAVVLDTPEERAAELLRNLVNLNLLESRAPGRYRYHDLLRLFARARADQEDAPDQRAAALRRLLDFYAATTRSAVNTVDANWGWPEKLLNTRSLGLRFQDSAAATAWLHEQAPHVLAAITQTTESADEAIGIAADLTYSLQWLIRAGISWHAVAHAAHTVVEASENTGDHRSEAMARVLLGELAYSRSEPPTAARHCDRAIKLAQATGDGTLLAEVRHLRAMLYIIQGCPESAIRPLREAATQFAKLGRLRGEANALLDLVEALDQAGRSAEAGATLEQVHALTEGRDDPGITANLAKAHGILLRGMGRYAEAVEAFGKTLAFDTATGRSRGRSNILFEIADTCFLAGDDGEAIKHATQSLAIVREIGDGFNTARALTVLGNAHTRQGEVGRGQTELEEAREIFTRLGVL
ncbi:BTAD domain-containing putative transcriptional regulator [Nonomuraea sp. NPDC050790]|uniref:BTAD domain-containing putative transcriptional regulator n=1 Tax=Nonomuraea sp. NPDC050790 TaxID=3364371 RepID=UPI0037A456EE